VGLLADFRSAAVALHRFPDNERLSPASLFALVRDMASAADDEEPPTAIERWRASQWTRHALLHQLYREFGLNSVLICATHAITTETWPWLPATVRRELEVGPLPDVHSFVRVQIGSNWMAVDATWPSTARGLGAPVNDRFDAGRDMKLASDPDELFHAPEDGDDLREYYRALVVRVAGHDLERRARFFAELARLIDGKGSA